MDTQEPKNPFISIHIPVALVSLALAVLFFSQIKGVRTATDTMTWQSTNADKQITALKDNREKLAKAIDERKPLVTQSEALQKTFTEMMKEVNDLSEKDDEDSKKIIVGYGIKIADNAPAAPEAKKDK
jgi:predicted transcriptional regulator